MSDDCVHGMTAEFCADCTGRDGGERALREQQKRLLRTTGWFPSKYGGTCANCGDHFEAGEPISAPDSGDGWRAGCCP